MARKANISKEEIIEACWQLIEQNTFPNIPRLSAYFLQLDGRACSNTTLLNAINDWEELYREQQESELSDLKENLEPSFKRFERDVVQALSLVLGEKIQAHEDALTLRQAAIEGRSDSLSEAFVESTEQVSQLTTELAERVDEVDQLQQQNQLLSERYEQTLSRSRVLESELEKHQRELKERDAQLSQAQVDLAKQDKQIEMLNHALEAAKSELSQLKTAQTQEYNALLGKAVADLQEIAKSLPDKKADS